jgi:hypothetical protein
MVRWDPKANYKFGFGCGYYLDGIRRVVSKGEFVERPVNVEKYQATMYNAVSFMVRCLAEAKETAPFFIIDDASPVKMDVERLIELTAPHPFLYLPLPENGGCGNKENIIQHVLSKRCQYVLRWDSDVTLDKLSLGDVEVAFKKMPDAWAITSCITYFARMDASRLPPGQHHFAGSNIADFVAYRSDAFKKIGYSDPDLRVNEDGDLRLRAIAKVGLKCYVDRRITGKAIPSGANVNVVDRAPIGEYIAKTRPFIRVVFPKRGAFRLVHNEKATATAKHFYIGPSPLAEKLSEKVWA